MELLKNGHHHTTYRLMYSARRAMQHFLVFDKHMKEMRSRVDSSAPKDYSHIAGGFNGRAFMQKKMRQAPRRQEEIARENNHLIGHLYDIHKVRPT